MDSPLRAAEPVSLELGLFLTRYVVAARPDDADAPVASCPALLDTLLATAAPWPVHLVLTLLGRIASALDAGAAAGIAHGTFTPRCVALDGPELTVACDDAPTAVDAAYVAPERRGPAAVLDVAGNARASQYGLAVLASTLLAGDARRARTSDARLAADLAADPAAGASDRLPYALRPGLDTSVERVLLTARDPVPSRRYATAGAFVAALDAACGALALAPDATFPDPRTGVPWLAREATGHRATRRMAGVGALVAGAALAGVAVGWSAAHRPAGASARGDVPLASDPSVVAVDDGATTRATPLAPVLPPTAAIARATTDISAARFETSGAPTPVSASATDFPATTEDVGVIERQRALARRMSTVAARLQVLARAVVPPRPVTSDDVPREVASPKDFTPGDRRIFANTPPDHDPVVISGTVSPRYPTVLLDTKTAGEVVARFVVDTTGHVDPATIEIVRSSHPFFAAAVRDALPEMRFLPAEHAGQRVRRAAEQTFAFRPPA